MATRVIDQLGNALLIASPPRRIISLVPSQTELLYHLGLTDEVVGITKYCVHPKTWLQTKSIIGGTKNFDVQKIAGLKPDLIIGNKEENYEDGIEQLRREFPVWVSDVRSLADSNDMIRRIGSIVQREVVAESLISQINASLKELPAKPPRKVLYFIWRKPWMVAGDDTFINDLLKLNNFQNLAAGRYPELSAKEIERLNPEVVLLSSEPYPFQEKHVAELKEIVPTARVIFVDGEMFSWFGSRLIEAGKYFRSLHV